VYNDRSEAGSYARLMAKAPNVKIIRIAVTIRLFLIRQVGFKVLRLPYANIDRSKVNTSLVVFGNK